MPENHTTLYCKCSQVNQEVISGIDGTHVSWGAEKEKKRQKKGLDLTQKGSKEHNMHQIQPKEVQQQDQKV